jgi:transposase
MRVVFGIDVSKASSEVAILVNGEKVHGYTIPNDAIGFNRLLGDIRRFYSANQIIAFIGIDLRHYESRNFLAKEHITKRGNPYARKILFKCVHNIASASHTNPCHIADLYEKRKRQSQVTSTKPHTIASIHRLIRTMYYLITHNKL